MVTTHVATTRIAATRWILLGLCILLAPRVGAEIGVTTRITGTSSLIHEEASEFSLLSYGEGRLDLKSYGSSPKRSSWMFPVHFSKSGSRDSG